MALQNNSEGLIGVRSGAGVIHGLTLALATAGATLTVAAGQIKSRAHDQTAPQRINEGGAVVDCAGATLTANNYAVGRHVVSVIPAGTLVVDDEGTKNAITGPMLLPNLTAMKMHSGNVDLGSVDTYLFSLTVTIAGTPAADQVVTLTVTANGGAQVESVSYTVITADTAALVAAGLLAAAAASAAFTALATVAISGAVLTVTPTTAPVNPVFTKSVTGSGATATIVNTMHFRNIDYSRRESL